MIIKRTFTRLRNFNLKIVARFPHCFSISGKRWGPGYILDLAAEYVNLVLYIEIQNLTNKFSYICTIRCFSDEWYETVKSF